jgi:hypothetical protein
VDRTDSWEADVGQTTVRADGAAVTDLLNSLARQEPRKRLPRDTVSDADFAGFGLATPTTSIELTLPGKTLVVRFGAKTREGSATYADGGPGTEVWIVAGNAAEQILLAVQTGCKAKTLTDARHAYDVGEVEVAGGGVTRLQARRDPAGTWRIVQPFKSFAEPSAFEEFLQRLVATTVVEWAELGSQDLVKFGLQSPRFTVTVTPKRGGEPTVVLVGDDTGTGAGVFALEKGTTNVAVLGPKFLESVTKAATSPDLLRDRSFSRLGIDGVALKVKIGEHAYALRKEGQKWDLTEPNRFPTDDEAVRGALDEMRRWETKEFLDPPATPAEFGIDGTDFVEVELHGGTKVSYLLGREGPDGTRYAQRRAPDDESGVERVDGAPLRVLGKGWIQFRQRLVRDFQPYLGDLDRIARDRGTKADVESVQTVVVERRLDGPDKEWKVGEGPGVTGSLDGNAVAKLLARLATIAAQEWIPWDRSKNESMGFQPPVADTLALSVRFSTRTGSPPGGAEQLLLVGAKRPEGGYFARMGADEWAFVLSEEDLQALCLPLTR